jgi:hypothetical protein
MTSRTLSVAPVCIEFGNSATAQTTAKANRMRYRRLSTALNGGGELTSEAVTMVSLSRGLSWLGGGGGGGGGEGGRHVSTGGGRIRAYPVRRGGDAVLPRHPEVELLVRLLWGL